MSLAKKYPKEVKQILSKYPAEHKRAAVMPLLYLAQREEGYLTKAAMQDVAKIVDITETEVAELVGFYTLYHDEKGGKYRMQVCTDLPCALRGSDAFMDNQCANLGIKVGETTPDGRFSLSEVECLGSCGTAPMFQINFDYHENLTPEKIDQILDKLP